MHTVARRDSARTNLSARRRKPMYIAQPASFDPSVPAPGQANKLKPTRSTVLRQSILLVVAPMTARAAYGQAHSAAVNSVTLRTGAQIPAVGLGVFLARYYHNPDKRTAGLRTKHLIADVHSFWNAQYR